MGNPFIVSGDLVQWNPGFGSRTVPPVPSQTVGTAVRVTIMGKPVCVQGDEKLWPLMLTPHPYVNASYVGGQVMFQQLLLMPDQLTLAPPHITIGGKLAILKGQQFQLVSVAMVPGMDPTTGPDPTAAAPLPGSGRMNTLQMVAAVG